METCFEALFLLAIDVDAGNIVDSAVGRFETALGLAILADLVILNRIDLVDNRVVVLEPAPTENPILDRALFEMADSKKARKLRYWINNLVYKKLVDDVGQFLIEKGALYRKKKRMRLMDPGKGHPVGAYLQNNLKQCLRDNILSGRKPDACERITLILLYHFDLLGLVFRRGEKKGARKQITKLVQTGEEDPTFDRKLAKLADTAGQLDN
jgi:hypothetical protein